MKYLITLILFVLLMSQIFLLYLRQSQLEKNVSNLMSIQLNMFRVYGKDKKEIDDIIIKLNKQMEMKRVKKGK